MDSLKSSEFYARLEQTRTKLLDLTKRNKLVSYKKPAKTRHLKIIDESPDFIYHRLVVEEGQFKFKYIPEPDKNQNTNELVLVKKQTEKDDSSKNLADALEDSPADVLLTAEERARELGFDISNELPEIDLADKDVDTKYIDDYLQTLHYPSELEKILKKIDLDARSLIQETGANMLYIILGVLEWKESNDSDVKVKSPLVNIPVTLKRENNTSEYILKYDGDGLDTNRALAEKLSNDFNIVLPKLTSEMSFSDYMKEVSEIISFKKDWKIKHEISLDFLNFSKILMYKDLDESKWDKETLLSKNPILQDLFLGKETGSVSYAPSEYDVDSNPIAQKIPLVMDADSSQHSTIVDVLEGKNLVIEGPPGTGKSQTISNMIAALLAEGKSVLFVSEKLAALEVVYKRLSNVGLDDFCLELHSHKSQKTKVLDSLKKRISGQYRKPQDLQIIKANFEQKKKELRTYLDILHSKFGKTEQTLFEIFWEIDRYHEVAKHLKFEVKDVENQTLADLNNTIEQLAKYQKYLQKKERLDFLFWNQYNFKISSLEVDILEISLKEVLTETLKLKDKVDMLKRQSDKQESNLKIREIEYIEKFLQEFSNEVQSCVPMVMKKIFNGHSLEKIIIESKSYSDVEPIFNLDKILIHKKVQYHEMKNIIELKKDSFFNFLSSAYKKAKKDLQNLLLYDLPKEKNVWSLYLEILMTYINEYKSIEDNIKLTERIKNSELPEEIKGILFSDSKSTIDSMKDITNDYKSLKVKQQEILKFYPHGVDSIMPNKDLDGYVLEIRQMIKHIPNLANWVGYRDYRNSLLELDLDKIVDAVEKGILPYDKITDAYKYNFYFTVMRKVFISYPQLDHYGRISQEFAIEEFKRLDLELMKLNRQEIAAKAADKEIPIGMSGPSVKSWTEQQLINNEISKQKRHIPIRQLVKRAGNAMKALKPCFMMSPLSVAQYIPPSSIKFDVLIVDEASQLRPEEALGVIARTNQIVIVGDPKQLPPTSFFDAMKDDDDNNDEETIVVDESESILDTCIALYSPVRRLRWHYRSQHESLIAFSNLHFYDNDLIVFPSPTSINNDGLGIKHTYIQNSVYQSSINKLEAKVVVEHIERQMELFPDKSLGVGTFNTQQRDLIQQLLDEKEKNNIHVANYLNHWKDNSEPFFIKNLESLQGDERDVIFISTTFGPDKLTGKVFQRFGPMTQKVGWRRLNVLITRSKQKMHVFTSMKSSDILVTETSSRGVTSLKGFLQYCESGSLTYKPEIIDGKGFDSPFEESVYSVLSNAGIKSIPQVGVAGYFIDLAVVSNVSDDYILAIECDGATYHSSKSARDRDRLKQEVLERLGWKVYRIWSTDWFKNRDNEISKLHKVVNEQLSVFAEKYKHREISSPAHQEIIIDKLDDIQEHPAIKLNLFEELQEEKAEQTHSESNLRQPTYKQAFVSDEKLKDLLTQLRNEEIAKEFDMHSPRCILSKIMIDQFVKQKPKDMDEFRLKVPLKIRENIDRDQVKFLSMIFDIIEMADE
jgi:superfamily I DNA and/or RNA helicase/very-short-patch-repair endonuclease